MTKPPIQDPQSKLQSLFDRYDEHQKRVEQKVLKEKTEAEDFRESFVKIRDSVIKPVFERFKIEFEKRGHKTGIEIQESGWDDGKNLPIEPSITFTTVLRGRNTGDNQRQYYPAHQLPHLSFHCKVDGKTVLTHESTIGPGHGGHGGMKSEFSLDQITEKRVEHELVEWFESLLNDATPNR